MGKLLGCLPPQPPQVSKWFGVRSYETLELGLFYCANLFLDPFYMSVTMSWFPSFLSHFRAFPVPQGDLAGRTVIVTGANVGLGLEASRHFALLNASRVILACRNVEKGEIAKKDIESSLASGGSTTQLDVWQLDLASLDSVKAFAARAERELERVDFYMSNAGVGFGPWRETRDGWEEQLAVNVIGTFLLALLMLPILRATAEEHGVRTRICVTSSTASHLAYFTERNEDNVLKAINANKDVSDRYKLTKLLQIMMVRQLAQALRSSTRNDKITVNSLHPGLCNTELFRSVSLPLQIPHQFILQLVARSSEMGSRALLAAALTDDEAESNDETATHGRFMESCGVGRYPNFMLGEQGEALQAKVWEELLVVLEGIQPGIRENL